MISLRVGQMASYNNVHVPSTDSSSLDRTMEMEDTSVIYVVLRSLFILLDVTCTILGNVVSTVVISRTSGFSDSVRVLMTSLCMADLGVGLTLLSSLVSSAADGWVFGDAWCKITAGLLAVCLSMSVFSLLGVSVDRLVAIRLPLRHPVLVTRRRVQIGCVALWLTSALIAAGNVIVHLENTVYLKQAAICYLDYVPDASGIPNEVFTAIVLCVLPLSIIIAIYTNLLIISAKHMRRQRNVVPLSHTEPSVSTGERSCNRNANAGFRNGNRGRGEHAHNNKALRMFLVVSLGFGVCWVPHFAMRLYGTLTASDLPTWLQLLYAWLPMSNSFWNVIIYTLMNGSFRKGVVKLLGCRRCCVGSSVAPQITTDYNNGDVRLSDTHDLHRLPSVSRT